MKTKRRDGEYEVASKKDMEIVRKKRVPYSTMSREDVKFCRAAFRRGVACIIMLLAELILDVVLVANEIYWDFGLILQTTTAVWVCVGVLFLVRHALQEIPVEDKVGLFTYTKRSIIKFVCSVVVFCSSVGFWAYNAGLSNDAVYLNRQIDRLSQETESSPVLVKAAKVLPVDYKIPMVGYLYVSAYLVNIYSFEDTGFDGVVFEGYSGSNKEIDATVDYLTTVTETFNMAISTVKEINEVQLTLANGEVSEEEAALLVQHTEAITQETMERFEAIGETFSELTPSKWWAGLIVMILLSFGCILQFIGGRLIYKKNLKKLYKIGWI